MTFRFLNQTLSQGSETWGELAPSALWRYHLHYFDDLNAFRAHERVGWHVHAIRDWIRRNPPVQGDAWAPFPTSLRITNWIKWALHGSPLDNDARQSLAVQARALSDRLEYHLLGNHLLSNAKALVFAGLFFEGKEADKWCDTGLRILAAQIPVQILTDGGQFERTPMYHSLAMEDVLDLINITGTFGDHVPAKWRSLIASWPSIATRMWVWLRAMCHPDGSISFFNDAAIGMAPSPEELARYAAELIPGCCGQTGHASPNTVRLLHLKDSGYVRVDSRDAVLLLDVAPVGPEYLPGHAHADTLSFELSLYGQRIIVNGGTSQYGVGPERDHERGTPAHSTVTIDRQNSSEVWAGFRVARRARPFDLNIEQQPRLIRVSCAHDGYRRLRGKPIHHRTWELTDTSLIIEDRITGQYESAVARFHLHPSVTCSVGASGATGDIRVGSRRLPWKVRGGIARLEPSTFCPEFGRRDRTSCLTVVFGRADFVRFEIDW